MKKHKPIIVLNSEGKNEFGSIKIELEMKWNKGSVLPSNFDCEVVGFIYCSCGMGKDSKEHRLNCYNRSYDIFNTRFDTETEEVYWSPCQPDYWMELPNDPEKPE